MDNGLRALAGMALACWWAVAPAAVTVLHFDDIDPLKGTTPEGIPEEYETLVGINFEGLGVGSYNAFNDFWGNNIDAGPPAAGEPENQYLTNKFNTERSTIEFIAGAEPQYFLGFQVFPFIVSNDSNPPETPAQITVEGFAGDNETRPKSTLVVQFLDDEDRLLDEQGELLGGPPFSPLEIDLWQAGWNEPVDRMVFTVPAGGLFLLDNVSYSPTPIPLPPSLFVLGAALLPLWAYRARRAAPRSI